jgi:hypothetical protein
MPQRWNIMLSFAPDSEVKNETLFPKSKYCFPSKRDTKRIQGCFFDGSSYSPAKRKKKRFEMGFKLLQGMTPMKDRYDDGIAKGTTI